MSVRIYWTPESEATFIKNLDYLSKDWDLATLNKFLDRVEEVLEKIKANPSLFPLHRPDDNIHRCVVHQRIVL